MLNTLKNNEAPMIDSPTSDIKKLDLYAAFAKRIVTVVLETRETLDRETDTLRAQIARLTEHEFPKS